ncbi:hypothetical protein [Mucilaginibacter sp. PPCGB 2223]|uniref:hypothetical protein n=1 Tax=Mucilaginibacter sp. PPCGB 2223 TaxID=1886027 RepID=UPI001586902A|nr:hypothetical protein [Mucilaginibacter sp. PPCGB 2223]
MLDFWIFLQPLRGQQYKTALGIAAPACRTGRDTGLVANASCSMSARLPHGQG